MLKFMAYGRKDKGKAITNNRLKGLRITFKLIFYYEKIDFTFIDGY
jgi:hypothetical protein